MHCPSPGAHPPFESMHLLPRLTLDVPRLLVAWVSTVLPGARKYSLPPSSQEMPSTGTFSCPLGRREPSVGRTARKQRTSASAMRLCVRTMGGKCELQDVDKHTSVGELQRYLHRNGCVDVPPEEQKLVRCLVQRNATNARWDWTLA